MKDLTKGILIGLAPSVIIAVAGSVFFDVIIDKFVIPEVTNQLRIEGHLNEDLKEGRYITTTEESFNKNYIIPSSILVNLKNNSYVLSKQFDEFKASRINIENKYTVNHQNFKRTQSEEVTFINSDIETLKNKIRLIGAKVDREFQIKVYYHTDSKYKGKVQLNTSNSLISELLSNGNYYDLSYGQNDEEFRAILRPLKIDGIKSYAPIASLYIDDHNKLFNNAKSKGIGQAYLQL